jgi:hypothetical protein
MELSFKDFLIKNKWNRNILKLAAVAIFIQFAILKYLFPFASFIHADSFSYLEGAYHNLSINKYMVGYSNFLRLFSVFTKSDTLLVAFQYLLVNCSALYFVFSLFYFYHPNKPAQVLILVFTIINPLFLFMANMVSSDCLFLALSLSWVSLLIWILHRPSNQLIICHTLILFFAFTVRYNAMIYPIIAIATYGFSKMSLQNKIVGISSYIALCTLFILFTGNRYKALTGTWQYSPFSGWQWANNAMYTYRYVDSTDRKPVPKRFQQLDSMIRLYFDTHRNLSRYPIETVKAGTYYMWSPGLPLYQYRDRLFKNDTTDLEFKRWAMMGPLYSEYGKYIIKQYPTEFVQNFVWPNLLKYYAPPVEFLGSYNTNKDSVNLIAKIWFGYKSRAVKTRTKYSRIHILDFYPILAGTMNLLYLCLLLTFTFIKGFKRDKVFAKGAFLIGNIWLFNAIFTVLASSAALRFQAFPIFLIIVFTCMFTDWLVKWVREIEKANLQLESGIIEPKYAQ